MSEKSSQQSEGIAPTSNALMDAIKKDMAEKQKAMEARQNDDDEILDDGIEIRPLPRPPGVASGAGEEDGDADSSDDELNAADADEDDGEIDNAVSTLPKNRGGRPKGVKDNKPRARARLREEMEQEMAKPKLVPARDEIPRDEINALMNQGVGDIKLEIKRKLPGGGWAQVKTGIRLPLKALFELREAVIQYAGGGTFEFRVFSLDDGAMILPRWTETYEGQPCAPRIGSLFAWDETANTIRIVAGDVGMGANLSSPVGQALRGGVPAFGSPLPGQPQQGQQMPSQQELQQLALQQVTQQYGPINLQSGPPPDQLPAWMHRGYSAQQQWDFLVANRIRALEDDVKAGRFQSSQVPQLANDWIHHEIRRQGDLKSENASLNASIAGIRSEMQAQVAMMNERAQRAERELERERSKNELAPVLAELAALKQAMAAPKQSLDLVGLAGALGPVAAAWMKSQADSAKVERESQMQMLLAMTKKDDSLIPAITALSPILAPVLVKFLDNNSPASQAAVLESEHEQKLMQLKMFADMIAAMAPADNPWYEKLAALAMQTINAMGARPQMLPPGPQHVLPPQQQDPQQQPPQAPQNGEASPAQPLTLFDRMVQQDPQAAQAVQMIYQRLPQDLGFHTHEWMTIMFNIQVRQHPEELAPIVLNHMINCQNFNSLPTPLKDVFENAREALERTLRPLPCDSQYIDQLIEVIVDGIEELQEDDEADEDVGDVPSMIGHGVIVTPAPTGTDA